MLRTLQNRGVPEFDSEVLKVWLTLRFNPSERCMIKGRRKVNRSRKLSPQDFEARKAWNSASVMADGLRRVLFEIVQSLMKEVPPEERIGVLSSGGIDSTALMGVLCKMGFRPEAFTIGFGGESDEVESARQATDFLGITHNVRILTTILASTEEANRTLDEPYRGACFYYDALRFVKDSGIKYVFDGLGVDEFFGGYDFRYQQVMNLVGSGMTGLDAYLQGSHPNDYVGSESGLFGDRLRQVDIQWRTLFPYFDNDLAFLDQIFMADYNAKCRWNFIPLAGLGSSLGINVFYPWLNDKFIDFSMRVPTEWKYDQQSGRTKILFRAAVGDLVPKSTMEKKKQGFGPTLSKVYEELRQLAEDTVMDGLMVSNGYVDKKYYRDVLRKKSPSTLEINKVWDLYTLESFLSPIN